MATQRKAESAQGSVANLNSDVVNFLLELADYERNVNRHMHKFNAYRKAAHTIAKCPTRIASGAEARKLDGVGDKIGKKIDEFVATGKLQKLEKIRADPRNAAITELTGVTGIGPAAAALLVKDGITAVADLHKHTDRLNHHQRIGLKYHADFKQRIPRSEMQQMEHIVISAANKLDARLQATICGSYRRGAKTSGDVDVLISHPSFTSSSSPIKGKGKSSASFLRRLVDALQTQGFITDEISQGESKFAGVCRRPLEPRKRLTGVCNSMEDGGLAKVVKTEASSTPTQQKVSSCDAPCKTPVTSATDTDEAKDDGTVCSGGATSASASSSPKEIKHEASKAGVNQGETKGEEEGEVDMRLFRRLDIRLIPHDQYACGILYFTGSDMFNKNMRAQALDVGFTLNEYSLRPVGSTGVAGEPVAVETERDIFDAIGMDFKEPSERNV